MTISDILNKFDKLKPAKKIEVLQDALRHMQQYNGRSESTCIALAMGYDTSDGVTWIDAVHAR